MFHFKIRKNKMNLNWYKIAQENQQAFDFYNDPKYQGEKPKDPYYQEWAKTHGLSPKLLSEIIDSMGVSSDSELKMLLNQFGFSWKEITFPYDVTIIVINFGGIRHNDQGVYVIDDFDEPHLTNAKEWISNIPDHNLHNFVEYRDFNKDFWDDVGEGHTLYHATNPKNKDEILKNGLGPRNKTRGINNRFMPSAIFTSDNPDSTEPYGTLIFEINVGQMKKDGYMPTVSMEEPLEDAKARESLAAKLGIEDYDYMSEYASEGLYENTVAFYDNIPPKYLKVYSE